jgi:hypothetical protein
LGAWGETALILDSIERMLKGLKRVAGDDVIEFYCDPALYDVIPHPRPAAKSIPSWFKAIKPVTETGRDQFDGKGFTAKKCMPLLDAMTAGWIIPLFGDVNVRTNDDCSLIDTGNNPLGPIIEGHPLDQIGGKTSPTYPGHALKFINPWVIRTADGVSSLFMPPLNSFEKRFTCLAGMVDTDRYPKQVNFPAVWHLSDFDEVIPAGTPLVTVIPVRRADLAQDATVRKMTREEAEHIDLLHKKQISRRSVYTDELREPRK